MYQPTHKELLISIRNIIDDRGNPDVDKLNMIEDLLVNYFEE